MINVLIADDEILFRNYMLTAVDWNELGFSICCVAQNGEEALNSLTSFRVDIAFLDINMPYADGISVASRIRSESPDTLIVFITGYSDFTYTQKAIQLKIEDYLLKPFSPEDLTKLLKQLKQKTALLRSRQKAERQANQLMMEQYFNSLLGFCEQSPGITSPSLFPDSPWNISEYFMAAVVEIGYLGVIESSHENLPLWKFSIQNCLEETLSVPGKLFIFNIPCDRIVVLFNFKDYASAATYPYSRLQKAADLIRSWFSVTLSIGIGELEKGIDSIPVSFKKALLALQARSTKEEGNLFYHKNTDLQFSKGFYNLELHNQVMFALRQNNLSELSEILEGLEKEIQTKHYDSDTVQTIFTSIFSLCLAFVMEKDGNVMDILDQDFVRYQSCFAGSDIRESCRFLYSLFEKVLARYSSIKSTRSLDVIRKVQEYVAGHYMEDTLSVEDIAAYVILDSSYIRKLFNKYMKCTITDFILTTRMEHARQLLEDGETNITYIASLTGYKDSGYFSKCFKKYYGVSPKAYSHLRSCP
ncbi:response regulator [Murimonas intestini]|uniref:response regulator n=1 Tax=Murimonas intestini TaxID=1337051 RepID=UPI00248B659B|nr:response regulator [Murimonas intestini]